MLITDKLGWSKWGDWEACSTTCGPGEKMRRRRCHHATEGSRGCPGGWKDVEVCNTEPINQCDFVSNDEQSKNCKLSLRVNHSITRVLKPPQWPAAHGSMVSGLSGLKSSSKSPSLPLLLPPLHQLSANGRHGHCGQHAPSLAAQEVNFGVASVILMNLGWRRWIALANRKIFASVK